METVSFAERLDYILHDTCKSTMLDSENSKTISKMLTEEGSNFKEYSIVLMNF